MSFSAPPTSPHRPADEPSGAPLPALLSHWEMMLKVMAAPRAGDRGTVVPRRDPS
ncbi:hypothetical protein [Streptomyces dysideae]|nr:hypothetical protein [Streptomyces dysideae]